MLAQFRAGAPVLWLKRMGRKEWERWYEPKNFADVDVLLLEWTHAGSADLKNTNLKVFLTVHQKKPVPAVWPAAETPGPTAPL